MNCGAGKIRFVAPYVGLSSGMPLTPLIPSSHIPIRLTWLVLAVLLASYCGWVVVPELATGHSEPANRCCSCR